MNGHQSGEFIKVWILGLKGLSEIGPVYTNPCHN